MVTSMDIDVTFSCDDYASRLQKIIQLRNEVIGSNMMKESALIHIPKLKALLLDTESPYELKLECCIVLGSIAKGTPTHVKTLYEHNVHHLLLQCLASFSTCPLPFTEACCRTLRSMVYMCSDSAQFIFENEEHLTNLVKLLHKSSCCQECILLIFAYACKTSQHQQLLSTQNAIPSIAQALCVKSYSARVAALKCLAALCYENPQVASIVVACDTSDGAVLEKVMTMMQKNNALDMQLHAAKCLVYLYRTGAIEKTETKLINKVLATLVEMCESDRVWMHRQQGAWLLAYLIEQDLSLQKTATISSQLLTTISDYFSYHINDFDAALLSEGYHGFSMSSIIKGAEDCAKTLGMSENWGVAVGESVSRSSVKSDESAKDSTDQGCVLMTSNILKKIPSSSLSSLSSSQPASTSSLQVPSSQPDPMITDEPPKSATLDKTTDKINFISEHEKKTQLYKKHLNSLLRIAAFNLYASLAANNEVIRKKILDSSSVVGYIKEGLSDSCVSVVNSTLKCLISLTRSVRQLRTNLNDNKILQDIINIFLTTEDEPTLCYVTALFANLLLEFSPCKKLVLKKESQMDSTEVKPPVLLKLVHLTNHHNQHIKLNSIWAIMNLSFDLNYDEKRTVKSCTMENNHLFDMVRTNNDPLVLQRALATIRNLIASPFSSSPSFTSCSSSFHSFLLFVDSVVLSKGREIVECVVYVLESDFPPSVKEQALCILVNLASGNEAKNCIMANNDILRKIINYLIHDNLSLELAAMDCIYNLVCKRYEGYEERKEILKQFQIQKVFEQAAEHSSPVFKTKLSLVMEEFGLSK